MTTDHIGDPQSHHPATESHQPEAQSHQPPAESQEAAPDPAAEAPDFAEVRAIAERVLEAAKASSMLSPLQPDTRETVRDEYMVAPTLARAVLDLMVERDAAIFGRDEALRRQVEAIKERDAARARAETAEAAWQILEGVVERVRAWSEAARSDVIIRGDVAYDELRAILPPKKETADER